MPHSIPSGTSFTSSFKWRSDPTLPVKITSLSTNLPCTSPMSRSYVLAALLLAASCGPPAMKPDPLKEYKEHAKPPDRAKAKAERD